MAVRRGDPCAIDGCEKPVLGRGWCSMHYGRWRNHGDPLHETRRYAPQGDACAVAQCGRKPKRRGMCEMHARREGNHGETTEPRFRRFWAQVDKDGPLSEKRPDLGPCWVWTGCVHEATGYGLFGSSSSGTRLVHRIAYQYAVGPIPKGMHLDHLCRRRICLRPDHLEPVTPRENIRRGDQGAFWGYIPDQTEKPPKKAAVVVCSNEGCDRVAYKRSLCRPHYRKAPKGAGRWPARTPEQRFWAKVEKTSSCWLWIASVNGGTGYGQFGIQHGRMVQAHRYSYELANGSIPEGLDVHHTCHVRRCVNPAHLVATTRSQNLAQRMKRR